jgi:beta-lactamase regulating signal transducer with metallopeptidase domain
MSALLDSALAAAVLDAAVRGTFIILATLGATALMRRTSASARHLVWLASLTALLLLPLARRFVPEWRVLPMPAAVLVPPREDLASVVDPASLDQAAPAPGIAGVAAPSAPPATPRPVRIPSDWMSLALLAWAAGAALFALRLAYGLARVRWMERRAVELTDEEWVRLTDGLSRRLGLGRIVRLLREPAATVPMTWGIFHPVILLPGEADGWESERRRVVLAHELAHVRRWDALTQWVAHVALVVYWFNPLVWMAVRKLREEREHACDDAVLEIGTAPADYADHLLTIVRSLGSAPGPAPAHALAMARRSQFEGRLLAILDNAVRRNGVSRAATLATAAAALACVLPLAAMRPAVQSAAAAAQVEETAEKPASPAARLVNRVADAVQQVTRGRGEADETRQAALDAAAAAGKTANAMLAAEQGSGSTAPPASIGAGTMSGAGTAELLRVLETRQDPGLYADIIRAAEDIESSTDRRLVLDRLLGKADLSHDNVVAIVGATRTMESDTDKRIVLDHAVQHRALRANPMPHVFFEAMRTFSSSTDQRVVLSSLLKTRRLDAGSLELLFRLLPRLGSDTDARVVLTDAARTQRIEGQAREAYLAATRAMDSDTDRRVALSALTGLDEARDAIGESLAELDDARTSLSASGAGTAAETPKSSARNSTTRDDSGESKWDADISFELGGRDVQIHAKEVVFGRARWDIRRINLGGSLLVQETRDGVVKRLRAVPGEGGRPVYTYTVDGRTRTFDPGARSWFEAVVREFTGD